MPGAIVAGPRSAAPSTLTVAATSGPVSICSTPGSRALTKPWTLQTDRRVGRPIDRQRPAVVRRRQVEEPGGKIVRGRGTPRHDRGAGRLGRAPVGAQVPRVRGACRRPSKNGRAGVNRTHHPSCTNSSAAAILQTISARIAGVGAAWCEGTRVEIPQRRQTPAMSTASATRSSGTPSNGPADAIGPQQRAGGQKAPERIH